MAPNDLCLLETIIDYCDDILAAIKRFSLTEEKIIDDKDMRALLAFFVEHIGEAANKLSPEFKALHPEIEWRAIVGFRNRIVHAYGKVVPLFLWDTAVNDIPELRSFCINELENCEK